MATNKYNIGDILMVPFCVREILINKEGIKYALDINKHIFPHMNITITEDAIEKFINNNEEDKF